MTEVTELLTEARARIARGWTQGANARDASGCVADDWSAAAVCWCAMGALAVSGYPRRPSGGALSRAVAELAASLPVDTGRDAIGIGARAMVLAGWNDAPLRTREDVLELYDRAIERSRS